MKDDFRYLVSVIIPVYNAQKYLTKAIRSLLGQTLSQDQIEILLIDDGSTDGSPILCDRYAEEYSNIRVFHQINAGVSAARNRGIREAQGKYLAYLDADDWLSRETLRNVTCFFDQYYDEIDLVSYPIVHCYPNGKCKKQSRDESISDTRLIDVRKEPGVSLTTMNLVVKNQCDANILFRTDIRIHEDIDYQIRLIGDRYIFGYLKEACYFYRRDNGGTTDKYSEPSKMFEPSMILYEEWMAIGKGNAKLFPYIQHSIIKSISWKMREGIFFPTYLNRADYEKQNTRFGRLLNSIDTDVILNHPELDYRDRFYLMAKKLAGETCAGKNYPIYVFFTSKQFQSGNLALIGMIANSIQPKSKVQLFISEKGSKKRTPVNLQSFSWCADNINEQDSYYGFCEMIAWKEKEEIEISAEENEVSIPVQCYFGPDATQCLDRSKLNGKLLVLQTVVCIARMVLRNIQLYVGCFEAYQHKMIAQSRCRRYYVTNTNLPSIVQAEKKQILRFRSRRHKMLFLLANDIVIGSPWENYIPIYEKTYLSLGGIARHNIILANQSWNGRKS